MDREKKIEELVTVYSDYERRMTHESWLRTQGMHDLGLPELEMDHVPVLFVEDAADLMTRIAHYMLERKGTPNEVTIESSIPLGDGVYVEFFRSRSWDVDDSESSRRWEIDGVIHEHHSENE